MLLYAAIKNLDSGIPHPELQELYYSKHAWQLKTRDNNVITYSKAKLIANLWCFGLLALSAKNNTRRFIVVFFDNITPAELQLLMALKF
jgi:hypothetical protein